MNNEEFRAHLRKKLEEGRHAFEGEYKDELNALMGLSRKEIDEVTPDSTDMEVYDQLITVVKEATSANIAQAELKQHIEELGDVAVRIAKKVPSLAALLV